MEGCSTGNLVRAWTALISLQLLCERFQIYFCPRQMSEVLGLIPGDHEAYFCGEGAEYECGSSEQQYLASWIPNYKGLKCAEGYRRLGELCVLPEECGCNIECTNGEAFILGHNQRRLDPMCVAEYSCTYNNDLSAYMSQTENHGCHADADCFSGECICRNLYEGNGYECEYQVNNDVDNLEGFNLGVSCGGYIADSSITLNPPAAVMADARVMTPGRLCRGDLFFMPPPDAEFPYIEIDQGRRTPVRAIIVRGYFDLSCWPAAVEVYYSNDGDDWECTSKQDGSEGCRHYHTSYQTRKIAVEEFRARYVRIVPIKSEFRRICLQVELFGGNVPVCPAGYTALHSGCYALIDRELKYSRAVADCSAKGGYVVEISSSKENSAVSKFAEGKNIWLGLMDVLGNSRFENPMGSPTLYSFYANREPNVMEPQWANIYMRGEDAKWVRSDERERLFVVCEVNGDALARIPEGNRLGAEFGREIPDNQFSSSTFRGSLFPEHGRLFYPGDNAGWGPDPSDTDPYLEVKFNEPSQVTGMLIQGRGDQPEWVRRFSVSYSIDCNNYQSVNQDEVTKIFSGPIDSTTPVVIIFEEFFNAHCVRVYPRRAGQEVDIALRVEFYGKMIKPTIPCMDSFLGNLKLIPDAAFATSSCPEPEDAEALEGEFDVCAHFARWNDNSVFWSPGSAGPYEFIEVKFQTNVVVQAIRVRSDGERVPAFKVHFSPDGVSWMCARYSGDISVFPGSESFEETYNLEEAIDLRYIRITPSCDNIPSLMVDILGCEKLIIKPELEEAPLQEENQVFA